MIGHMMSDIREWIKEKNMIEDGDRILLGLSGGADSVCLFFQFKELKKELDFEFLALYVDHGIRGEESAADGRFVQKLCEREKIECIKREVDAPSFAKENKLSLEEAARMLRYGIFSEVAEEFRCNKVATAHNANDNAETVLFRMIRGSGAAGLTGIPPVRKNGAITLIRPLLRTEREEIEHYLNDMGQSYVTDSTNADNAYARNRLRNEVIPALQQINSRAVSHINEAAEKIERLYQKDEKEKRDLPDALPLIRLQEMNEQDRQELILAWLKEKGAAHDVTRVHLEMLSGMVFMGVGKEYHLPHGFVVKNGYEELLLGFKDEKKETPRDDETEIFSLKVGEKVHISVSGWDISLYLTDISGDPADFLRKEGLTQKNYAKFFDYDKIEDGLVLRHRRPGDYLVINPDGATKKLQDYLVDAKVPKSERDELIMLCSANKVLWIPGYRTSEDARVDENTKTVLSAEYWRS